MEYVDMIGYIPIALANRTPEFGVSDTQMYQEKLKLLLSPGSEF